MHSPIHGKHDLVQKASPSSNRLLRAMYGCTDTAKLLAYKGLVPKKSFIKPCLTGIWLPCVVPTHHQEH